jgi:hypothetical protein
MFVYNKKKLQELRDKWNERQRFNEEGTGRNRRQREKET